MSWEAPYPAERLVPYDDAWPAAAARLAAGLVAVLGEDWVVEHVGSTSVPGLVAKPVIDLAVRVPPGLSPEDAGSAFAEAEAQGWSEVVAVGGHHASVRVEDGVRRAVAHLFRADRWETAHVRLLADRLRRVRTERDAYAALKRSLVSDGEWGASYTEAKSAFVRSVLDRARAERGLGPEG